MPCWSGRFAVAALALGTAGLASATAQRPDLWKSTAGHELEYRVRLRDLGRAPDAVAVWVPYPAETRDQRIPVDASEAKKKDMPDAYFGTIPNDRIEFTAGRDVVLSPPQHGEPLNYFVYPYAEAHGKALEPPRAELRFRRMAPHETTQADEVPR